MVHWIATSPVRTFRNDDGQKIAASSVCGNDRWAWVAMSRRRCESGNRLDYHFVFSGLTPWRELGYFIKNTGAFV